MDREKYINDKVYQIVTLFKTSIGNVNIDLEKELSHIVEDIYKDGENEGWSACYINCNEKF